MGKSALEKLRTERPPEVHNLTPDQAARLGGATMAISTPGTILEAIRAIPRGKVATTNTLRDKLAGVHEADICCPMTTGIFVNIAANAAHESGDTAPWWRLVKVNGELNPKFPGGAEAQAAHLEAEGFSIDRSRKVPRVEAFEDSVFAWPA